MSGMQKKTEEEKYEEICRFFCGGMKIDEIAEKMHCGRSTVDRAIALYGSAHGHIPKREVFADHGEEAVELFNGGKTYQEIADETGLSASAVRQNLAKMGLCRRRRRKTEETVPEHEEPGIIPLQYADNTRKAEKIVIRGKTYADVSAWYM